jgi:beta-glucosidase
MNPAGRRPCLRRLCSGRPSTTAWPEFGTVLGREGRALDQDVLLSPMTNVLRVPHAGRNFETFGEDPQLSSRMVTVEIQGIQSQGLIATVEHLAANNQEVNRMTVNAAADEWGFPG